MIPHRVLGLDILRCIAILCVLFVHCFSVFYSFVSGVGEQAFNMMIWAGGFYGVEFFFVLSGFLIGNIFIRKVVFESCASGTSNLKLSIMDFWIRRWIRTLPSYYLFIIINILLIPITAAHLNPLILVHFLFFLQGFGIIDTAFMGISWSLAIEEWFYLLLPLIFTLMLFIFKGSKAKMSFMITMAILLIVPLILKLLYITTNDAGNVNVRRAFQYFTLFKLDSIFYGLLTAWLWNVLRFQQALIKHKNALFVAGLMGLLLSLVYAFLFVVKPVYDPFLVFLFGPLCSLSITLCIPWLLQFKNYKENFLSKTITNISLISYSLYLVHQPIISIVTYVFKKFVALNSLSTCIIIVIIELALSFWVSYLLFHYFEKPVLNWRDKISFKIAGIVEKK